MATKTYTKYVLTGGGTGALDAIDGDELADNYRATVITTEDTYHYILDASSGEEEDGISVIAPDSNPTTKRWLLISSHIPIGGIILWAGPIASIPSGWYLCDGNNGTPNLTDRFVIHADADANGTNNMDDTGGSNTISEAQLPSHSHGDGTLATDNDSHSHGNDSLATNTTGAHTHEGQSGTGNNPYFSTIASKAGFGGGTPDDNWLKYNTSSAGDHSHTISGSMDSDTHSHDVTGSTGSIGSGSDFKPKYYALAYIMRGTFDNVPQQ